MLTQERYQTILQLLSERDAVTVAELSSLLDISESTIRRDLNNLAEMGKLKKVFGGATAIHANTERLIQEDWKDIVSSSLSSILKASSTLCPISGAS